MWSCERGNRSRNNLESVRRERRVPTCQVFLDAVSVGSVSPASLCGYHPGVVIVCPQLSLEGTSPSKITSATAQLIKNTYYKTILK